MTEHNKECKQHKQDADSFKPHLKNIKKEYDVWFEQVGDWSHCIEIEFEEELK